MQRFVQPFVQPFVQRFVQRPDARIAFQQVGSGPAVLLVQGVGCVGETWSPQMRGLADRFTLIAPDNRGIGDSTTGPGALTIEAMAEDALAVVDAVVDPVIDAGAGAAAGTAAAAAGRFHLVGHSMGGLIAQEIALRAPQRVASLALMCTFARGKQGARLTPDIFFIGLRTRVGTRAMRRNAFLELVMPPSVLASSDRAQLAEQLRLIFGHDLADQHPIAIKQLGAMVHYDARARLPALAAVRTLVVSADQDRIALPRFGRELAATIPGARYVEIADAGHAIPIHRPDEVNALLAAHFTGA